LNVRGVFVCAVILIASILTMKMEPVPLELAASIR
jgi:hypothetical protein